MFASGSSDLDALTADFDFANSRLHFTIWIDLRMGYLRMRDEFWKSLGSGHPMEHNLRIRMLQLRNFQEAMLMTVRARAIEKRNLKSRAVTAVLRPVDISSLSIDGRECSICKVPYGEADEDIPAENPVEVPCEGPIKHVFGHRCIQQWLDDRNRTCPIDRTPILLPDESESRVDI